MKNKLLKFFRNFAVFLMIAGILFSNIPFNALSFLIDSYEKTSGVVDKIWLVQQENNSDVVDKFLTFRDAAEKIKVKEAQAAVIAQYTGGLLVYADTVTVGTPKYQTFDDTTGFGAEQSAQSVGASAINWIRVAASPTNDQWIIATRDAANVIKAQVCTGVDGGVSCGTPTTITATAGTHGFRNFDVAYEQTSGDALLVYGTATADELRKIELVGGSWINGAAITTTRTTGQVEWVELTSRPASNQIGIAYSDVNDDISAYRWDGTTAANEATAVITASGATGNVRKFDISFEGTSGDMLVAAPLAAAGTTATGQLVGTTWTIGTQIAPDNITDFIDLQETNAGDNDIAMIAHGVTAAGANTMEGYEWSGTGLTDGTVAVDTSALNWLANYHMAATAYVNTTYYAAAVFSDTTGADDINWWTMNSAGTWVAQADNLRTRGNIGFIDLFDYPNMNKVLLISSDANSDLWADTWDGTTPSATVWVNRSATALETSLSIATKDVVDFAFRLAPPPNSPPTLTVTQPDGVGDTVTVGDLYNITYDLADTDNIVTAAMYYDADAVGLNGTAITGACATAAEGTGATCSWNTTGMTAGSYYVYGITNDGVNPQVSDYSPGVITINAPAANLTISQTAGLKVATKNSGDMDQYAHDTACTGAATCAAFTLAAAGGTVNVTSIKVTENGTVTADNELSDVNLYYDFDGNWSDAGAETLFGTQGIFAPDQTATISGTLAISAGATAYIYVRYFLAGAIFPTGGATVNFQIASAGDVVSDGTESGTGTLGGTQTVKPQITGYTNSESGLNYAASCTGCGARIGPYSTTQYQTIVISGYGFGADPGAGLKDSATNKVEIVGAATTVLGDDGSASTNVSAWSNTSITIRTNSELATNTDTDWGTNFGGATALKVTAGGQAVPTNLNFYIFPQITSLSTNTGVTNGAREYSASDNHGVVTLNGTRFGSSQGTGYVRTLGCDSTTCSSPTGSVAIDSWSNIAIAARVPTVIADSSYTGAVDMQQGTGGNSKTHTFSTLRILPRIISTGPVDAKGGQNQAVTITGNHFCQDAACADYATDSDDTTFNAVSGKASYTAVSDTSISLSVPATATDGNLIVKSDSANGGTVYDSNSYSYNVKFGPSAPTGSSAGGSNNPTLSGTAFSDGTDGDTTHQKTQWQLAHSTDGDWSTPEWSRTTATGLTSAVVDTTDGGTFANGDVGQTALDCGGPNNYKGRVRYMDNGNGGADTQTWEWSSYSADYTFATGSCNNLTVGATGTQTANITRGTNTNYLGGSFTLTTNNSAATITLIKISNIGNITAYNNLNNVKLYYDTDGVWSGTFTETQLGSTQGSFASGDTVTFGSLSLGITNTAITYIYVVSDIDADPTSGQLIDIQITNPLTDVAVTGASNSDTLAKAITGSTTVANPNVNVASAGTQTANMSRGSTAQYVGGSFTLTMASATGILTSFAITDNGTVTANTNLNNVKLYYDTDGTWSGTFTETQLGTTQTFNVSEKATFNALSLGLTTSATYVYVVLDVNSAATAGQTIEIRVAASGDVVGTGFNTSGTFPLDITGTTTIADPSLTVSTNGSQTANLNSGDTAQNIGGSFTFVLTGATGTLNSFVISEMGNVGATANLTNVKLQSDTDGTYPGTDVTGCTALSFNASQQTTCTPTGGLSLSATTARYVYVIVNLGSGATGGETIEIQITNPSTDVSVTGASNTDTGIKAITGTTTIKPQITGYTNSESGLNYAASCTGCGARIGPYSTTQHQTIVISGYGFGADPGAGLKDSATNKVEIVGAATTVLGDDGSASTNVSAWSNTSITIRTNSELATNTDTDWGTNFGGATALKVTAGGQAVPTNLNFYIFPQIISLSPNTGVNNGAREYSALDNHGVVILNGTRFGSSQGTGYVRLLGCDSTTCSSPTGSVAIDSWSNIAIAARVPTVIADSSYTGAVDMQQGTGGNSKTHTFSTLRILPRITSLNPNSGATNDPIVIIGNHFCQTGTCPLAGSRSTASDNATFYNAVQVTDGNVTAWGHGDSSTSGVNVNVPATAETGNVIVESNNYISNGVNFTKQSSIPNDPANLYQFETNTDLNEPPASYDPLTETNPAGKVAVGGGINQTNAWMRATASAGVNVTLCIEVEAKTVATAFDGIGTVLATSAPGCQAFTVGTPVKLFVNVTTGLTDGNNYKWRARIKNNGTSEYSNWVNADVDGSSKSFYIDTTAPTMTCSATTTYTASTADISWSPTDGIGSTFTKQVQYGTDSTFATYFCTPGATCGTPSSGLGANAQTVQLTDLMPNTAYYYRARSKDGAGNEKVEGYGLSGNTACTFTTSKANMRTAEYFITGETNKITTAMGETSRPFNIFISESGASIQNAFIELSGISDPIASQTIRLRVNNQTASDYSINASTYPTPFTILHKVNSGDFNTFTNGTSNNTLYITVLSADVSIASAKIIVTYYYTPSQ